MSTAGSPTIDFERLFKLRRGHEQRHATPKCATHRSLAGAHELEDVFWVEGLDGKRQPRKGDQVGIEPLIQERTPPVVTDARGSLVATTQTNSLPRPRSRKALANA